MNDHPKKIHCEIITEEKQLSDDLEKIIKISAKDLMIPWQFSVSHSTETKWEGIHVLVFNLCSDCQKKLLSVGRLTCTLALLLPRIDMIIKINHPSSSTIVQL